jgi:hypothetical protein
VVELGERGRHVQLGVSRARALPAGVAICGKCDSAGENEAAEFSGASLISLSVLSDDRRSAVRFR